MPLPGIGKPVDKFTCVLSDTITPAPCAAAASTVGGDERTAPVLPADVEASGRSIRPGDAAAGAGPGSRATAPKRSYALCGGSATSRAQPVTKRSGGSLIGCCFDGRCSLPAVRQRRAGTRCAKSPDERVD